MSEDSKPQQNKKSLPAAEALELKDLVEYGDGAVVSRTLVDKSAGSLTLFAFDAGQGISEHSAPYDALVQGLEGEGELIIGGKTVRVTPGQLVMMPADVPHAVRCGERFKWLLTMIRTR